MLWTYIEFGCVRRVVIEIDEMKVQSRIGAIQCGNSGEFVLIHTNENIGCSMDVNYQ